MAKNNPFPTKIYMPPPGTSTVAFVLTKDLKFAGWIPLTQELIDIANGREYFYMSAKWNKEEGVSDGMLALLEEEKNKHW